MAAIRSYWEEIKMQGSGILIATVALAAALVPSEPAAAFRGRGAWSRVSWRHVCWPILLAAFLLGASARGMDSAQSQTPHSAPVYYGWGISLAQPSHDGNWLHYSIPTHSGKSLKAIKVKFSTGANGYIDAIHIWDSDAPKVELEHLQLKGSETNVVPLTLSNPSLRGRFY
jgi:hypothetical protein